MNTSSISSLEVKECYYKFEHYSVREDGMIMRHHRVGMGKRKKDDIWSYGTRNDKNGYLFFCGERVHRIVATAFHGEAPSDQHVVDHIDTNRQNNRPENLRWVTKLENILNNEITRKKVELICGSIEEFLRNPQLLWGHETEDANFSWMRSVTKEEGLNSLENWSHWAKTAVPNPNYNKKERRVDNRIYSKKNHRNENSNNFIYGRRGKVYAHRPIPVASIEKEYEDQLFDSLTPSAKQRSWVTPTEFPCCPLNVSDEGLKVYYDNLNIGNVFSSNRFGSYYVVDKGFTKNNKYLLVFSTDHQNEFLSWAVSAISIENGKFVHENVKATAGKELSEKLFKYIIGEGELTSDEINFLDCI